MRLLIGLFGFAAVFVAWNLACKFVLLAFGIRIPLLYPFTSSSSGHEDVIVSLKGKSRRFYTFIFGFLLFVCPSFAGLMAYDRLARASSVDSAVLLAGSIVVLALFSIAGVSASGRAWKDFHQ